jgi:hypothetical protein
MTLYRISPDDLESFTIVTNPKKSFSSSSSGITGAINLYARRSDVEKETYSLGGFESPNFDDANIDALLSQVKFAAKEGTDIQASIDTYLNAVNEQSVSARSNKELKIFRTEPSVDFSENSLRKNLIRDTLYSFYRSFYPTAHWGYTNYHTLNFLTASGLPSDSALLYPNSASNDEGRPYSLDGPFTFEFQINPRYTTDQPNLEFKAGTIMHLSSSYAISLVTGSSVDSEGYPNGYRIMLQLSHSADIPPSEAVQGAYPNDLIFLSQDNSLKRNHWHHVAIRWGTNEINEGSGSFVIDGIESAGFVVPSSSIAPAAYGLPQSEPDVLCIGNFYEGFNTGSSAQSLFFNTEPATRDGLANLAPSFEQYGPDEFTFDHPLNAEVHDLRIYNVFRLSDNILRDTTNGPEFMDDLVFYLPPFFTKESPFRRVLNEQGGVLQTPFFGIDSTTDDPFNVAMSFGVGGHYLNLENFLRDFSNGIYPRQLQLTGTQIIETVAARSANEFLYNTGSIQKRNISILPCDNGLFTPNFDILVSGGLELAPSSGSSLSKFVNDLGSLDLSHITLNEMIPSSSLRPGLIFESGSIFDGIAGATPDNPGVDPGEVLTIFQRTKDNTSNEVIFFDISDIYYGNRINPGSFEIKDSRITGSGDKVSITIKDNGYGNLYRADSLTPHAEWNSVGNIFYNEGVVVIKSPNIPFFGKEQYEMSFEGESTIHVLKVSAEAASSLVNSSSHPDFLKLSSSFDANETDPNFVYITNIDFLDENLNVVMKTNLGQPVKKRSGDKILFRVKMDF